MSLMNRLSLFFLAALAVVLFGFSVILYLVAHRHLHAGADHRLDATIHTLTAGIEIHPGDVEWEPLERKVTLGEDPGADQVRWMIHDPAGRLIDCSGNLDHAGGTTHATDRGWRVLARRVSAGRFDPEALDGREGPFDGGIGDAFPIGQLPGSVMLPRDRTFHGDALILTVAVAEEPVQATLTQLAWTLVAVSGLIWLTAAIWGRWLCRRALRPIAQMAASARSLRSRPGEGSFLDVAPTGDELEDLGKAFNELLAALRESLEQQRRFTGDASHQLRTPLTALLAGVEVALRHERSATEYQRILGIVQRRGVQLRQIIESLLFLARAEADSSSPDQERIELVGWCRSRLDAWADHPRSADLRFEPAADSVSVRIHPALLGQVLDNLVDNAIKYSAAGTPVVAAVQTIGGEAVIAVSDEGCGIAADERDRVFEPFFRTSHARWAGTQGVGLGLTVARRLVALLGGRVSVESEPEKGSRFRIILPIDSTIQPGELARAAG
jgi:signal transduction histidine kinase